MKDYFAQRHPWAAACYMTAAVLLVMAAPYGRELVLIFAAYSISHIYRRGIAAYLKSALGYSGVILFFMLFNVLFNHMGETPFLYVNDTPLTVESLVYGMYTGIMVCTLFMWFTWFQDIFDNQKIIYLFGSRFPVLGLILGMIFCFYDKFLRRLHKIQEVWNSYGTKETMGSGKHAGIILSVLLSVMLEDSVDTALSMKARGYGSGKRSQYRRYRCEAWDIFLLLLSGLSLALLFLDIRGKRYAQLCFLLLPVVYNLGKELQWKYYLSRM